MNKIILLFIIIFMFSCANHDGVKFIDKNFNDLLTLANNQNKMIMLDFWSDG